MKLSVKYISKSGNAALVAVEMEYTNGIAVGGKAKSGFVMIDSTAGIAVGDEIEIEGVSGKSVRATQSLTEDGNVIEWLQW